MMPERVVEIVPARLLVVEIVTVLVVEMVPALVVEMVPLFARVGADMTRTSTAAKTIDLEFFICCLLVILRQGLWSAQGFACCAFPLADL